MSYFREFWAHWPNLLGATIGLGFGISLKHYTFNLFGPPMLAELGWSKAEFALVGSFGIITLFLMPIVGRFTDRFGARATAAVGFATIPIGMLAFSMMSGNILQFYLIDVLLTPFAICTGSTVFTRVVVERFTRARGVALSMLLCGSPIAGAVMTQVIGDVIIDSGWRAGFRALALASTVGGAASLLLMGVTGRSPPPPRRAERMTVAQFKGIVSNPVFLLLFAGMCFCNFPNAMVSSQLSLVLMDNGATAEFATTMISLYAISVVVGRFIGGVALDRIPPHLVAMVALSLPMFGFFILASPFDSRALIILSIVLIGLAQGAESDVSAMLTSRKFPIENFSFIFSLLMAGYSISASLGAIALSATLAFSGDDFDMYLILSGIITFFGGVSFYLTGRVRSPAPEREPEREGVAA